MALNCAAASMRLAGRAEDEADLRDAWQLCPAGADPGPAGAIFGAWRQLALQPLVATPERLEKIVDQLGLHWDRAALADLCRHIENLVAALPAPSPRRQSPRTSSPCGPTPSFKSGGSLTWCWRRACAGRGRCRC
ncbi:DUF1403 family protein [Mesorhizobium sp. VK22B]|uniref:DUF1403 family protein n=1 Tax=Mesorhizobium captivum TaxID=3072319 RepID=A0ABU4Z5A1_9HYPH|nr:DUF1403 family protein [Mesorhizobium sp. VK22B]MDX8494178.1 DUF1403 family protein [Mesorhizobium sp. VK22B]